ncbi:MULTISPECIES: phosphotransferase family protein [Mycobacterium]|uniref:Aminoglycoside phosphotransferase n=1 Tax=Mycobacterium kiyosense TaxID=2871094 RepID=A0A9P3QBH8_9MYCO|nr:MULTISPECIES: phosphotransferase family protein [Mycobacterium]BDE11270.1 putative aminoglycoside phosphotransferase [Mycobacterium sp. 20KCMC460]GLB85217.1 putative aminoglycoside phosphotransferase [Mycobacterium kiyosense]GLB91598.1 putative aminoglycoside phosphotransferase [Mycobacterium kiyosense]GLB96876.1 putative aminoglycoside phosphotransferase [Mycobacterium kiyosense]GLC02552.1 putative aminoglycoside phosphotransferase [Mycobacterium kiyosense]
MTSVDLDAVARWMSTQGLGEGPLQDVTAITGGTQNVMLRFTRSGRSYVLRRGPRHLRARSNSVILRETRVLAALADSDVPHPHLIASCDDTSVLGDAVFYLMEPIEGFNAGEGLPPLHAGNAEVRHGMGLSMADALAKLGAVDHVAVGLADYGKPEGFLERQVPRWLSELESYQEYDGYPGPDIPGIEEVAGWLERNRPTSWKPGIMHGDYHAANVMFSRTGPEVVAICDWEMSTIGDPLLDLGWLLATWRQDDGSSVFSHALGGTDGLASTDELLARYAENTTRDLSHIDWYTVLACFKLGIVIEGTLARACAGKAEKEVGDQLHAATVHLFERALRLIETR